jgi:hypothetical protein
MRIATSKYIIVFEEHSFYRVKETTDLMEAKRIVDKWLEAAKKSYPYAKFRWGIYYTSAYVTSGGEDFLKCFPVMTRPS